jgi:transposase
MGWHQPVPCKILAGARGARSVGGTQLLQTKLLDIERSIRGLLRGFGLKIGEVSKGRFAARVEELIAGHAMLEQVIGAMLAAREALRVEFNRLHRAVLAIARKDAVCRRLMTAQGMGVLTAITYKSAVDDPARFAKSKAVGAHFGLTQKRYQSGETDIKGGVSKVGDVTVRTALFEPTNAMLTRSRCFSSLKSWGLSFAKHRGVKRAKVAAARKLAVIPRRMWVDETDFRWGQEQAA